MIKDILVDLLEPLRLLIFKFRWRNRNRHNFTKAMNRFPINRVEIGNATYGGFEIHHFQNPNSKLIIKSFCSIADGTKFLLGGEHKYNCFSTYPFKRRLLLEKLEAETKGNIIINDDVWIGNGVTLLSGVEVGQGCIIGAGSIVTKSLPPYSIYAGGKIRKFRFSSKVIELLLEIDFEKINKENVAENLDSVYLDDINLFLESNFYKQILKQDHCEST